MVDVLLVEDNPLDARATMNAAAKLSMRASFDVVADGQAAVDHLRAHRRVGDPVGLVLLDLNLPGMDGHDVLAEIRSDPDLGTLPVVILTSSSAESDVVTAYRLGANAYVSKPAGLDGWVRTLSTISDFWLSLALLPPR